jgi:hypothetical protein
MAVGSSVDGGVGHSSDDELGEESLECDGDGGEERGDGYDCAGTTTCERVASVGETSEVAAGMAAAEVDATADGTATVVDTHCGGTAGQSAPYSFLTRWVKVSSSAASTCNIHSR